MIALECWQSCAILAGMTHSDSNPYAPPRPLLELAPELSAFTPVVQGSGQLSWSDFQAGQRLSRSRLGSLNSVVGIGLVIFGFFMIWTSGAMPWDNFFIVALCVVIAILALRWFRRRRLWYQLWAHPMGLSAPQLIAASSAGLLFKSDHSIAMLSWSKVCRFRLNTRVLLLIYLPHQQWQVIPRSYFNTDEDWHAFVDIVQANVPQG